MLEEQIYGVVVGALGSPLKRCRNGFASFLVDIGAVVDQELA